MQSALGRPRHSSTYLIVRLDGLGNLELVPEICTLIGSVLLTSVESRTWTVVGEGFGPDEAMVRGRHGDYEPGGCDSLPKSLNWSSHLGHQ